MFTQTLADGVLIHTLQSLKWTETLVLGLVTTAVGVLSIFLKEFFTSFNNRLGNRLETAKVLNAKEKDYQTGVLGILDFLEKRNEFLTKEADQKQKETQLEVAKLHDRIEALLIELHKTREDKIRLEVRSEFRMQMVRDGHTEIQSYERVTEMQAFSLQDADSIIISDDDKRVYAASAAGLKLLGYDDISQIRHCSIDEIFPGIHAAAYKAGIVGASTTVFRGEPKVGLVGKPIEVEGIKKDGTRFRVKGAMRTWTDGKLIFYAFVMEPTHELLDVSNNAPSF